VTCRGPISMPISWAILLLPNCWAVVAAECAITRAKRRIYPITTSVTNLTPG
jgi:hypothetical protein